MATSAAHNWIKHAESQYPWERDALEFVRQQFPDYPPYGGVYDEPVPHLTIGAVGTGTLEQLRAAETAVRPRLPIESRIDEAAVMVGSDAPNSWTVVERLPLG